MFPGLKRESESSLYEANKKITKYTKNTLTPTCKGKLEFNLITCMHVLTHFPREMRNVLSSIGQCANSDHLAFKKPFNQDLQEFHEAQMYPL